MSDQSSDSDDYQLVPLSEDLVARLDTARDDLTRDEYIRLLMEQAAGQAAQAESEPRPHEQSNPQSDGGERKHPRSASRSERTSQSTDQTAETQSSEASYQAAASENSGETLSRQQSRKPVEPSQSPAREQHKKQPHGQQQDSPTAPQQATHDREPQRRGTTEESHHPSSSSGDAAPEQGTTSLLSGWQLSVGEFILAWTAAIGLYGAGDLVTTWYGLANGAVESNPIMQFAIGVHPLVALGVKIGIVGGLFYIGHGVWESQSDDVLAVGIPLLLSLVGGYATLTNLSRLPTDVYSYVGLSIVLLSITTGAAVTFYEDFYFDGEILGNTDSEPSHSDGSRSDPTQHSPSAHQYDNENQPDTVSQKSERATSADGDNTNPPLFGESSEQDHDSPAENSSDFQFQNSPEG